MTEGPQPGDQDVRLHMKYDAWNRLVEVRADDDGDPVDLIASYQYDGLGRRTVKIVRQVDGEEVTYQRTDYLYNEQWQVLEERTDPFDDLDGEGGALATVAETVNVQWLRDQRYIDAPVLRWRSVSGTLDEVLYFCNDANMNVTALVDATPGSQTEGEVVERYMYDPYGKATVCEEDWTPREDNASAVANDVLYCGYRFDAETGLYHVRYRYYHPTLGRWVTRDPLGYVDDMGMYAYCMSAPPGYVDWSGLLQVGPRRQVDGQQTPGPTPTDAAPSLAGLAEQDPDLPNPNTGVGRWGYALGVQDPGLREALMNTMNALCPCFTYKALVPFIVITDKWPMEPTGTPSREFCCCYYTHLPACNLMLKYRAEGGRAMRNPKTVGPVPGKGFVVEEGAGWKAGRPGVVGMQPNDATFTHEMLHGLYGLDQTAGQFAVQAGTALVTGKGEAYSGGSQDPQVVKDTHAILTELVQDKAGCERRPEFNPKKPVGGDAGTEAARTAAQKIRGIADRMKARVRANK